MLVEILYVCVHIHVHVISYITCNSEKGSRYEHKVSTWEGKSLCYATLSLVFNNFRHCLNASKGPPYLGHTITVVVSPLLVLIRDQAATFQKQGLQYTFIGHELSSITQTWFLTFCFWMKGNNIFTVLPFIELWSITKEASVHPFWASSVISNSSEMPSFRINPMLAK